MSNGYYNYNGSPSPGPGPNNTRPPKRPTDWGGVSWALSVAMLLFWPPLGLILTFAHAAGHDLLGNLLASLFGGKGTGQAGRASGRAGTYTQTGRAGTQGQQARTAPQGMEGRVRRPDGGSVVLITIGAILAVFGVLGGIANLAIEYNIGALITGLAFLLSGGAMVVSGIRGRRKAARFRRCLSISGTKGIVDMRELAKTMGMKLPEIEKTLEEMVDRGYYGPKAYVDSGRRLLVIDVEDMRDVYRREDEAKAGAAQAEKTQKQADTAEKTTEYERYVELIRQADVEIEDEAMSEKIRRMQNLTASIFAEVEAHPEKRSQIDRFMNYYLPTTLKLLEAYARIERRGVTGENMAKAKADIEGIADTLVAGYEKQLDQLYKAEAMDIAGDVSVIENMLRRDGLAGGGDFEKEKGQTMGGH